MDSNDIPPLGEQRAYQFIDVLTLAYKLREHGSVSTNDICDEMIQTFHRYYWNISDKHIFMREVEQAITALADKGYFTSSRGYLQSSIEQSDTNSQSHSETMLFRITIEGRDAYKALNHPKHGRRVLDWIVQNGIPVARQLRTVLITYRLMVIAKWLRRVRLGHVRRVRYPNALPPTEGPQSANDKARKMIAMHLPSTEAAGPSRRKDRMITPWLVPLIVLIIYIVATISGLTIKHADITTTAKVMAIFAGAGAALGSLTVSVLVWYRASAVHQVRDPEPDELRGRGDLTVGIPYRETLRRWFFRTTDAPIHYRVFMSVGAVSGFVLYWICRFQGIIVP